MPETEFKLSRAETAAGTVALVTIDNGAHHTKPTTFGRAALASLAAVLPELERGDWVALVLTGKPFVFAAGADIHAFKGATGDLAAEGSRAGHELFARLRALPYPTVAAVNGACLGGGVEIALHCDARTISSAVRHFAAPECFLGIVPGWGGTQLVPRLVGPRTAVRFIVEDPLRQNRMLDAAKAFDLGFADRLLEPAEFLDESLAYALAIASEGGTRRADADLAETVEIVRRARSQLDDALHGAAPAPYRALDLIEGAANWSVEEGYRAEEEALRELLPSRQAQASIYAFDLVEFRAKRRAGIPKAEPRRVRKIGIVGAGLMATQLATLFLRRLELPIAMRDLDAETAERGVARVRAEIERQVQKGRHEEGKGRFLASLVTSTVDYADFADCDLVLEAVFEELPVKQEVFGAVEAVVSAECVLATNTSSLSVAAIGEGLAHPERLVGMHFFNPVALMPLVELIRAPETDDATLATVAALADGLRKRGVLVKDGPGFVVNRVLTRMTSVLMDAIDHGTPVEDTDEAILRLGMPMAPSVLLQMVGPRVANHVLETMHDAFPDRFPLSATLRNYAAGSEEVAVHTHAPRTVDEVLEGVLEAVAREIGLLLEEGIVAEAADVDTCLLLGAGYPFFLGGITPYLDATGVSERVLGRKISEVRAVAVASGG